MPFVLILLAKVSICLTILVYSTLLAENSILTKVFTQPFAMYYGRGFLNVIKTIFCAVCAIGYDLTIHITNDMMENRLIHIVALQVFFIMFGVSLFKQSIARRHLLSQMKRSLRQLILIDNQTSERQQRVRETIVNRVR